jgi:hypothetical protein
VGAASLYSQSVNAVLDQAVQGIIHKAVACHPAQSLKALAQDSHGVVTTLSGPCVPRVKVAVIDHFKFQGLQGRPERSFDGCNACACGG